MPNAFPALPSHFIGREDFVTRFKARVEHFSFFLYEGISGVGKTSLLFRLAKEASASGMTQAIYLPLGAGEGITSILTRVEARFKKTRGGTDRQGDPYTRLMQLLGANHTVLILDNLQRMHRDELPTLVRASRLGGTDFRILAACRGDPELSAMERSTMHLERVGPLKPEEVEKIAQAHGLSGEPLQRVVDDSRRGGSVCHPLTLNYMLGLGGGDVPAEDYLRSQSARSVNAFKALMIHLGEDVLKESERNTLTQLAAVGLPISQSVATKALGPDVASLIKRRLLDVIGDDVYVHNLVRRFVGHTVNMSGSASKVIAKHLQARAATDGEPNAMIRAGELLARSGEKEAAVDTLARGWETVRDLGWLEQYLKTLSSIQADGDLAQRVRLLSARARMRKGDPSWVREEMEDLAKSKDEWTCARAHTALTFIYRSRGEHDNVLAAFAALRKATQEDELIILAGGLAAASMARLGRIEDAIKLSLDLLERLETKGDPEREGEMQRLLARVYAQSGRLEFAVAAALAAATAFEKAGDLYHAATAHGFIGDLYRETGDFELAKKAFARFHELANLWGDRDLTQIAELADAWVSLDVGDMTHAAQKIAEVEKEMSVAPSKRLKRYLAAARALLEVGRGRHKEASTMLVRVIEAWEQAGQRATADILRAQQVRSLLACGQVDLAERIVQTTLKRLDAATAAPRVATFLRESALIRLRRRDSVKAMRELSEARKLFAAGGNRREEALTLHRIAHAALEEGDVKLAGKSADEAFELAQTIQHARAVGLAQELQGRVALARNDVAKALDLTREALQILRRLGDDVGVLHVSESLLRIYVFSGDLASAIRLGPKVRDHADQLGIQEVRVRAIILSGAALMRRSRLDAAMRCFRPLRPGVVSPQTQAMMWRLGEALGFQEGNMRAAFDRRQRWVQIVSNQNESTQSLILAALRQMMLPPRDRGELRVGRQITAKDSEELSMVDALSYDFFVDLMHHKVTTRGVPVDIDTPPFWAVLQELVLSRKPVPLEHIATVFCAQPMEGRAAERAAKAAVRELSQLLKSVKGLKIVTDKDGVSLAPPESHAYVVPKYMVVPGLTQRQQRIIELLGRLGTASLAIIQERFTLTQSAARRELSQLCEQGVLEAVRDGRGQSFRTA